MLSPTSHFDLTPYLSTNWFSDRDRSSIFMSVYRLPTMKPENLPRPTITYDFSTLRVRALISYTSYTYHDMSELTTSFVARNSFRIECPPIPIKTVTPGVYLAITTPLRIDGVEQKLTEVEESIFQAVSLLICVMGRAVAYEHVFSSAYNLNGTTYTLFGQSQENYWVFGSPSLGRPSMKYLKLLESRLFEIPHETKNRISLSLRWFRMASYDRGIDAFLKLWIAIETISMPTTNIGPLKDILAAAYCISRKDVEGQFAIGRIYGFRSGNVHDGFMSSIDAHFLRYVSCLFSDVLFQILMLPPMHKALACLNDPSTGGLAGLLKQIEVPNKHKNKTKRKTYK